MAESIFIGIDLTDPFAKRRRECTRAILRADFSCTFDEWEYTRTGSGLVPAQLARSPYFIAIDGPQGLAGTPGAKMRICERQLRTAGKSSYTFSLTGQPYAGFVRGSVELFRSLCITPGLFLYGLAPDSKANLVEVYPGAAWTALTEQSLKNKHLPEGRRACYDLMVRLGITFTPKYSIEMLPTHDELDATLAAYIAYLFGSGRIKRYGEEPFEDTDLKILREGFIVQPD
jgi:hypothetical protein